MSSRRSTRRRGGRDLRRLFSDNPVVVLTLVFVGLFVATDIVNRVQSSEAFLTPKQVSTTFLYAAILGLIAAGQTLVMLTGGVDLSVATTATTGAFMISSFATDGAAKAIAVALLAGLGIGIVNGIGVAIFRVNPLIMTLGVSTVTLGALTIYSQTRFLAPAPELVKKLGSERFFTYVPYGLLVWVPIAALIILGLRYSGFGRMIYAVGDNVDRLPAGRRADMAGAARRLRALRRRSALRPGSSSSASTTRPTSGSRRRSCFRRSRRW